MNFNGSRLPESNSGIYGIVIEAQLPKNWAVEVNGLYRPLRGSDNTFAPPMSFEHTTYEFPVLLKHRFLDSARFRPMLEGGPSFRAEGTLGVQPGSRFGLTFGAGLETKLWSKLRVTPMVRYTRWGSQKNYLFQPQTWANQTQLLVSFTF